MANLQALRHQIAYNIVNTEAFQVVDTFVSSPEYYVPAALVIAVTFGASVAFAPEIGGWVVREAGPPAARWIVRKAAKMAIAKAIEEGVSTVSRGAEKLSTTFRDDHQGSVCAFVFTGLAKRKVDKIMDRAAEALGDAASEVIDHMKILN